MKIILEEKDQRPIDITNDGKVVRVAVPAESVEIIGEKEFKERIRENFVKKIDAAFTQDVINLVNDPDGVY